MEKFRVLVADDDEEMREVIKEILEESIENLHVLQASDGMEALDIFKNQDLHLVISDFMMPRMDGFHFLLELRKLDSDIPVIIVTGFANALNTSVTLDARTTVLGKPFDDDMLVSLAKCVLFRDEARMSQVLLLVDSSMTSRFILKNILSSHGDFCLYTAESRLEAKKKFNNLKSVDLVLISRDLEDKTDAGIDLGAEIHQSDREVKLVLLDPEEAANQKFLTSKGFYTSIKPPVDPAQFLEQLFTKCAL